MQDININITKAAIKSFNVELEDLKPHVSATISLKGPGGKEISTFSISTRAYYDKKMQLAPGMIQPILNIAEELEAVVARECNKELNLIEAKPEVS